MSELFGSHPPKKRKIQTIFLGSFDGPLSAQSASITDTFRNGNTSSADAPPPLALSSAAFPTCPSSSSFVPSSTNAQFSPIRHISSPIFRLDERRNGHEIEEELKNSQTKRASNTSTPKNEGETTALLMNHNHSSVSVFSLEGGTSSLNGSATIAANGEEQQLPPLPELSLESGAKLRAVPQMCHLQHSANKVLELPTPQAQKELEFRLKLVGINYNGKTECFSLITLHKIENFCPRSFTLLKFALQQGPSAQIDRIIVQNSLSNKRTLKSARILAKFGRDTKWHHIVPSPVLLIRANRVWTVLCLEDQSFLVLHSQTGRVSFSLVTQSVLALLELRDHFCLSISADATAQLWDLQCSRSLFRSSIRSLFGFSPDVPRIVHTFVSAKGLPVIVLNNGDAFVFSLSLQSWLSFQIEHEFVASKLCSMQSIAKTLPDGLIATLLNGAKIDKSSSSSNFVPHRMEIAASKEEREIEMLLRMTRELDSWEEFRFLTVIYVQLLLSRGKSAKLVEFIAELRSLSQTHDEFPFSTIVSDLHPLLAKAREEGIDVEGLLGSKGTAKRREMAPTDGGPTAATLSDRTLANLVSKFD